jgi:hypothetical protein
MRELAGSPSHAAVSCSTGVTDLLRASMLTMHSALARTIVVVLAAVLVSISCARPGASRDMDEEPAVTTRASESAASQTDPNSRGVTMGKPLFSCGYANFAWGSTAYGHVLDDQGQIWFYDLGTTWSPQPAGAGLYLESKLRERFRNPVLQSRRVPPGQLATMRKNAEIARSGRIEELHAAYDSGGAGCEAYIWERSDAYREVELGSSGDYTIRNSSPEAAQLQKWLREELGMGVRPKARLK